MSIATQLARPARLAAEALPTRVQRLAIALFYPGKRRRLRATLDAPAYGPDAYSLRPMLETRTIFVHVPKAAGISIARALYGNRGMGHWKLRTYAVALTSDEWSRAFRFSFVRNPYARLYSAFVFLRSGGLTEADRRFAEEAQGHMHDFNEFVMRWLRPDRLHAVPHFVPQHEYVRLPYVQRPLDYLGHFETLATDYEHLRSFLGFGEALGAHNRARSNGPADLTSVISDEAASRIAELYHRDFELFGYDDRVDRRFAIDLERVRRIARHASNDLPVQRDRSGGTSPNVSRSRP